MKRTLTAMAGASLTQAGSLAVGGILASRLLGPHDRGLMVLGATSGSIAALVAALGTSHALRARLPRLEDEAARRKLIASYTWLTVAAVILGGALATVACQVCGLTIDEGMSEPAFLLAVLLVTTGQTAMVQFPDTWFAAGRFRTGSTWAAAVAAGGTVGIVLAALLPNRTAWVLLVGQALGMMTLAVAQAVHLRSARLLWLTKPDRWEMTQLLRSGVQSLSLTIGLALALRADRYILGGAAGADVVGVYSTAATLSEAPRFVPAAMGQMTYRKVTLGCERAEVDRAALYAFLASLVTALPVAVAGWFLIVPVFGSAFGDAKPLLLVLLLGELLFAPFAVASRGLLGGGWMGHAGLIGASGTVGALLLYSATTPVWGAAGAAWSSALLYSCLSLTSMIVLRRRLARRRRQIPLPAAPATAHAGLERTRS
ncbi:lipopolysaccharide biosynthesis protein [Micromonospora luteifusca]|uniref:lipopolysaccharide biosynthesis protein n=1 Tax=Micromonospora luteifusca TaxID=709860 RepID=UPI0033B4AE4F